MKTAARRTGGQAQPAHGGSHLFGAGGGNRTHPPFRTLDFESSASSARCHARERRDETERSWPNWKCWSRRLSSPRSSSERSHLRRLLPGDCTSAAYPSSHDQSVPRPERPLPNTLLPFDRMGSKAARQRVRSYRKSNCTPDTGHCFQWPNDSTVVANSNKGTPGLDQQRTFDRFPDTGHWHGVEGAWTMRFGRVSSTIGHPPAQQSPDSASNVLANVRWSYARL